MSRDALAELQAWNYGHKARSVGIDHDNGYGSNPGWSVSLIGRNGNSVLVYGMGYPTCENEFSVVNPDDDDADWPRLEAVILLALDKANELGL